MLISRAAVDEWLDRELYDCSLVKRYSEKKLDRVLKTLRPRPRFVTKPHKHQKAAFLLTVMFPQLYIGFDMGLGKSLTALNTFAYHQRANDVPRGIVLVPLTQNLYEWEDEIRKHQPGLSFAILSGTPEQAAEAFEGDADLILMTYAGFLRMVTMDVEEKQEDGKTKTHWAMDPERLDALAAEFDMMILDEPQVQLRHHDSLSCRCLSYLRKSIRFWYLLSGTQFNEVEDLWSQFWLVDQGETLGKTLGLFRSAFFTTKKRFFGRGVDYVFREEMTEELNLMLCNRMIRYAEDEVNDLPPKIGGMFSKDGPRVVKVTFPPETLAYHKKLVDDLKEARGNFTLVENAFIRLRQIASGYLSAKDPEGERVEIRFKQNPLLEAMVADMKLIPESQKGIIFVTYKATGRLLLEELKKRGFRCVAVMQGVSKAARRKAMKAFKTDPKVRFLIGTQAIIYGTNAQVANWELFYETPTVPIDRRQAEKRAHRYGQKKTVYIKDYVVKGSIGERIVKSLRAGADLFEDLIEARYEEE